MWYHTSIRWALELRGRSRRISFHLQAIDLGEKREKVRDIYNSFVNKPKGVRLSGFLLSHPVQFLQPHRRFIRDGILLKVCRKSTKARTFFLFKYDASKKYLLMIHSDVFIYGTTVGPRKYMLHQILLLQQTRLEDVPEGGSDEDY